MNLLAKSLGTITTAVALSLSWSQLAQAITITSDATWSDPVGGLNINGEGTDTLAWGTGSPQSSYNFTGNGGILLDSDAIDGAIFKLGTFTHNNFPIGGGSSILGATLNLNLDIANGAMFNQDFTFDFAHNETPNTPPCSPAGATNCPDVVSIPDATSSETVEIDGKTYNLKILGFSDTIDGPKVNQFITEEGQANQTMLFAKLNDVSVPEPTSILGLFALAGLGTTSALRKQKKAGLTK